MQKQQPSFKVEENTVDIIIINSAEIDLTFNVIEVFSDSPNSKAALNLKKGEKIIMEPVESVNGVNDKSLMMKYYSLNKKLYFNTKGFIDQLNSYIRNGEISTK